MSIFKNWGKSNVTDANQDETSEQANEASESMKSDREKFLESLKPENYSGETGDLSRKNESESAEDNDEGEDMQRERERTRDDDDNVR